MIQGLSNSGDCRTPGQRVPVRSGPVLDVTTGSSSGNGNLAGSEVPAYNGVLIIERVAETRETSSQGWPACWHVGPGSILSNILNFKEESGGNRKRSSSVFSVLHRKTE